MNQIKKLSHDHYPEIFKLSQFAFQYTLNEVELEEKEKEAERHEIWGWLEEEQLCAKVHMIPLQVNINGNKVKMGGIASVASWPEYRRGGMIKKLLLTVLQSMKENGYIISYLHPFSVPFYRRYGYELTFPYKRYQIPIETLKKKWSPNGYARRSKNYQELDKIYSTYINRYNGGLIRDEKWWQQRVIKKDTIITICYNDQDEPEGYLLYHVKDRILYVEDMAYVNSNGLKLILQLLSNHDSMVTSVEMKVPADDSLPLLVDEPRYEQKLVPYFMSRIVDVSAFLRQYRFRMTDRFHPIAIEVEDEFLPENTGTYYLTKENSDIVVSRDKPDGKCQHIYCSVQQLTSILLSYQNATNLAGLQLIQGDVTAIQTLDAIIPNKQTYFPDFF